MLVPKPRCELGKSEALSFARPINLWCHRCCVKETGASKLAVLLAVDVLTSSSWVGPVLESRIGVGMSSCLAFHVHWVDAEN